MLPRRTDDRELAQLQAEWDEKLRDSGFQDAEDRRTGMLRSWSSTIGTSYWQGAGGETDHEPMWCRPHERAFHHEHESSVRSKDDKASYYRMVGVFLHEHRFRCALDRKVWRLHADGFGARRIGVAVGISKWRARSVLRRLRRIMLAR